MARIHRFLLSNTPLLARVLCLAVVATSAAIGPRPVRPPRLLDGVGLAGLALIAAGLGWRSWAAGMIRKERALATGGPYRACRHPLYLGTLTLLTGFVLVLSPVVVGWPCLLVALGLIWLKLRNEEGRLAQQFGPAWDAYRARTPRLLPVRRAPGLGDPWSPRQWLWNREYEAVASSTLAVAVLAAASAWLG